MTSPLTSTNSHGIRVVADRAPLRPELMEAFEKGSCKAAAGIDSLVKPHKRSLPASAASKRSDKRANKRS